MKLLHSIFTSLLGLAIMGVVQRKAVNYFLMGVVRDVGRIKARKRRLSHNSHAVTSNFEILLRRDDPLQGVDFDSEAQHTSLTTYTSKELSEYGDGRDGRPLLLSVFGRVYDVSAGEKFYGDGGAYHMFAGKDVTKALCTGCKEGECLVRDTTGLTERQISEGKRWLSFFQMHDKYAYKGNLEGDSESWLDMLVESSLSETLNMASLKEKLPDKDEAVIEL